ncbi:MAG: cupin domain-containing protein [Lentimicrobium sp.]|nr:cupin domain-containing protein [Lentimicrobium sp.]HPG32937.1 cupin domain-containing protein [Lentimicrobium sp.]
MKTTRLHEAPKVPFNLDGHIVAHCQNIEVIHLHLKPGEILEKHTNPFDVILYVLEGKAMIEAGNEKALVQKDESVCIEAGTARAIENISVSDFKLLVIKIPNN